MKITDVRARQPEASHSPGGWRASMGQISVAVDTDSGLTGYGIGGGGAAGIHVIEQELRPLLLGADGTDVEGLWEAMYRASLAYGRKGLTIMAISGVDLALWDLRGKDAARPIAALLSDTPAQDMPAYSTTSVDGVAVAVGAGFGAVKVGGIGRLDPQTQTDEIVDLLGQARRQVGDDLQLMTDAGMGWRDREAALRVCERLAELELVWLEEPLPADDLEGYAWLVQRSPVPIAAGEHEFTARGFAELMARGCHHIYQPDICWCGGLTQVVEIYRLARAHEVRVCPHRGSEVWGIHAIAALDPEPLAESGRPWMEWVGGGQISDGRARWTAAAGFGVELDV
jgi:L-alanine-DL-glutamate epimerase-like enolase superfamily enzyme